ncbi:MAG: S8 family serine peptidase [Ignavibacteriaceae bacterium]|jgi:hypothetical protein|nr:S8 family serine peptidase [Ignavibacteriaceae bacterium]GIK22590.1 MAG: hypothetical protein BroJett005_20040 [Ignavibacteriota bacterium]
MANLIAPNVQKLLLIIFVISLNYTNLVSQENPKLQAIIMFEKDILSIPEGKTEAEISELKINSFEVQKILLQNEPRFIKKAFPLFSPKDTLLVANTGEFVKLVDLSNIYLFEFSDKNSVNKFINEIKDLKEVVYAETNYHDFKVQGFPNDPNYENGDLWGLNNYGQNGGTTDADIDAPEAWQITTGSNVVIAVIDDGVDAGHEDLTGKVSGDAGVYGGNDYWTFGHGTHVSGIAGAFGNNSKGIAGVNWAANINSQRIENGSDIDFYNGIMSAVNSGSKILNNSWGGYVYSTTVRIAFANAYKLNVVSLAAMGNDNTTNTLYPAGYGQGIISVGATDRNDLRSIWIRPDGTIKGSNYGNHIDVSAPGTSIWSTYPFANQYVSWNGTSMATPYVTGIASLLFSINPNLYNDDIEQIIRISADDKGVAGWDQEYGTGRVNAYNALRLLQAPYQLSQLSSSSGTNYSTSDLYQMAIFGANGLADGMYLVKRHEVRKIVSFPYQYDHYAWGRGVGSNGWSAANPNFGLGFCSVVDGSLTSNQATLSTYVYEVWSTGLVWKGWFPSTPQNVSFNYTVLGKPLVAPVIANITQNPVPIYKGTYGYVYCNLSQGNGNLTYNWFSYDQPSYVSIVPEGYRCKIIYLNTASSQPIDAPAWTFGCTVSNAPGAGWSDTETFVPSLNSDPNGCPTLAFDNRGTLTSENPLLITSMSNPGKDVTDYYLINTPLTPVNNKINLTIHEPQTEHTWFDNVSLLETRANPDEKIVVNDEGQVINYKGVLPARILLNGETDITQNLLELDSLAVELNPGDKLTISRNAVEGDGDVVLGGEEPIIVKDRPSLIMNILTESKDEDSEEIKTESIPITNFFLRPNKSIISKRLRNLPTGTIEITVNKKITLDYFVFVTDLRTAKTRELPLVTAVHNVNGDVKTKLTDRDQNYAEMYPTERIDLSFSTTINSGNRAYILKTVGRYETDTTFVAKQNNLAKLNEQPIVPTENKLYDNYPNPFNPSTIIKYSLKDDGKVSLKIFNSLGEEVRTLVNEIKPAGNYEVEFNASELPSGIYIYSIQAGEFISSKKMILLK